MGNAIFSKRIEDSLENETKKKGEKRLFPSHMYTGPLKLGDPFYRGLSKMEEDPMIPQRMRDIGRELCPDVVKEFCDCTNRNGFKMIYACTAERDKLCECIQGWLENQHFKDMVTEEYLNERSHFRQTGIKTKRYARGGKFILRDEKLSGPMLDENGKYRPQKPTCWDESYPDGQPAWTNIKY